MQTKESIIEDLNKLRKANASKTDRLAHLRTAVRERERKKKGEVAKEPDREKESKKAIL